MRLLAEGGIAMYLIPPAFALVALFYAAIAFFYLKGKSVPGAALLVPAVLPILVGAGGTALGLRMVFAALAHVDAADRATLLAAGLGEANAAVAFGALASGLAALGASFLAFLGVAAVDRRALGSAPALAHVAVGAGVGAMALAGSVALHVVWGVRPTVFDGLVWLALLAAAAMAALAAPASRSVESMEDEAERGRLWRRAALPPVGMGAGLMLVGLAGWLLESSQMMGALAAVDPAQRAAIIGEMAIELAPRSLLILVPARKQAVPRTAAVRRVGEQIVRFSLAGCRSAMTRDCLTEEVTKTAKNPADPPVR